MRQTAKNHNNTQLSLYLSYNVSLYLFKLISFVETDLIVIAYIPGKTLYFWTSLDLARKINVNIYDSPIWLCRKKFFVEYDALPIMKLLQCVNVEPGVSYGALQGSHTDQREGVRWSGAGSFVSVVLYGYRVTW